MENKPFAEWSENLTAIEIIIRADVNDLGMTHDEAKDFVRDCFDGASQLSWFQRGKCAVAGYEWNGYLIAVALLWRDEGFFAYVGLKDGIVADAEAMQKRVDSKRVAYDGQNRTQT